MGYKPTLHLGDEDPEGTIQLVLDGIIQLQSIAGFVRNSHDAFIAFSDLAVAASLTANELTSLAFGSVFISQRNNTDFLAHAIQRCHDVSAAVGYTITLEELLETKEEDLHRHVARLWLAGLRGAVTCR